MGTNKLSNERLRPITLGHHSSTLIIVCHILCTPPRRPLPPLIPPHDMSHRQDIRAAPSIFTNYHSSRKEKYTIKWLHKDTFVPTTLSQSKVVYWELLVWCVFPILCARPCLYISLTNNSWMKSRVLSSPHSPPEHEQNTRLVMGQRGG